MCAYVQTSNRIGLTQRYTKLNGKCISNHKVETLICYSVEHIKKRDIFVASLPSLFPFLSHQHPASPTPRLPLPFFFLPPFPSFSPLSLLFTFITSYPPVSPISSYSLSLLFFSPRFPPFSLPILCPIPTRLSLCPLLNPTL